MKTKNGNPNDSTKTSVQGVRKHARNGKYIATYTKYLGAFDTIAEAKAAREKFIAKTPAGRLGIGQDIAGLATFLASDDAGFCIGGVYMADGGADVKS